MLRRIFSNSVLSRTSCSNLNCGVVSSSCAALASTRLNSSGASSEYGDDPFSFDEERSDNRASHSSTVSNSAVASVLSSSTSSSSSSSPSSSSSSPSRCVGTITKWVDERGFGFVNLKGKSIFLHAREILLAKEDGARRSNLSQRAPLLSVGQEVEFTIGAQPDGRLKATAVSCIGGDPIKPGEKKSDSSAADGAAEGKVSSKRGGGGSRSTTNPNVVAAKLFSSYQWNFVESGNTAMDGFQATRFNSGQHRRGGSSNTPSSSAAASASASASASGGDFEGTGTAAGEDGGIAVPGEKWTTTDEDEVELDEQGNPQPNIASSGATASVLGGSDGQGSAVAGSGGAGGVGRQFQSVPNSSSRPIWESELLGWPTELAAREMDFFDIEELEERRSGWFEK